MKEKYTDKNFQNASLHLIAEMNSIVNEYIARYRITVRKLYYQLVARGMIENTEKSYKRITTMVNDAKLAGLMDWDVMEDRTRAFIRDTRWESGPHILRAAVNSYHEDMWTNQATRVFAIIEKEALVGVLEGVCRELDIPLLAARGYPSGTVLREFAESDLSRAFQAGQRVVILHLGDHDPSGIDMTRDLIERLRLFGRTDELDYEMLELKRIALNMPQIEEFRPPKNPAKSSDSRFKDYEKIFGKDSWELDALQPDFLGQLVRNFASDYIDPDAWEQRENEVGEVKNKIEQAASNFDDGE